MDMGAIYTYIQYKYMSFKQVSMYLSLSLSPSIYIYKYIYIIIYKYPKQKTSFTCLACFPPKKKHTHAFVPKNQPCVGLNLPPELPSIQKDSGILSFFVRFTGGKTAYLDFA